MKKQHFVIGLFVASLIFVIFFFGQLAHKNEDTNWQVVQGMGGEMTVRNTAGWYFAPFATITTYPRFVETTRNNRAGEGKGQEDSVRVTFNDGGKAKVEMYMRFSTPTEYDRQLKFHRQFGGSIDASIRSVEAHMNYCAKITAPLMSASENQSGRKAEFATTIGSQIRKGSYKMRKQTREYIHHEDSATAGGETGTTTGQGQKAVIYVTEIVTDADDVPVIDEISPLITYGIGVEQFSIEDIDYDPATLEQFSKKQQSYLNAEESKAAVQLAVQKRIQTEEEGKTNAAEAEALANVVKVKAQIEAEQKVAVAEQQKMLAIVEAERQVAIAEEEKKEAEVREEQKLAVAIITKQTALTEASQKLEVQDIAAQEAISKKAELIAIAEGKQKSIELSGAITEFEQASIDANVKIATTVSQNLANIQVPGVVIFGGSGDTQGDSGDSLMKNLINMKLIEGSNILNMTKSNNPTVKRSNQ